MGRRTPDMQPLLSLARVAELLDLGETTVRAMINQDIIPARRVGTGRGSIRISEDDLQDYLQPRLVEHQEPRRHHARHAVVTMPSPSMPFVY
jgi:excisionase family DNA binding protein